MNLSEPFIKRPIMTTLVMFGIFLFGAIAYRNLPISDLPSIEFPTITVSAINPGMNAETMASNVATPLEQQMMAIDGLENIISSSQAGATRITAIFSLDKSLDAASTDVAAAINRAQGNLPPHLPQPPQYQKTNPADAPIIYIAVSSETMTLPDLYDYANNAIAQRLSMIEGVSQVQTYGSPRALRVKVNPDRLAAMNIGLNEVAHAVDSATQSLPAGTVFNSNKSYTLNPAGQVTTAEAFDKVIVAERNGRPVYIGDIGHAVESTKDEYYYFRYWNREKGAKPSVVVAITKQSGANTVQLCDEIEALLPEMSKELPAAMELDVVYSSSVPIKESIWDVKFTLAIAFALVILVIFLFLGKMASTVIPSVAIPLSVVGTFGLMYVNGYSIDILSMLGLILVVGFLVDDAIVVLENIVRHLEMGKTPFQAALDGSKQISTTVLSMTLALSAVFVPIIFMPGIMGRLFHEFGMVVVIAVLFSGFVSLSLTPMLCSKFLKEQKEPSWVERMATKLMTKLTNFYMPLLHTVLRRPLIPIGVAVGTFLLALLMIQTVPKDFLPAGDTGAMEGITLTPQDVSLHEMARLQDSVANAIKKHPAVKNIISVANLPEYVASNQGVIFVTLVEPWKRKGIAQVNQELEEMVKNTMDIQTFIHPVPQINLNAATSVQRSDYTYTLSTINNPPELYESAQKLTAALHQLPDLRGVSTDIEIDTPQLDIAMLRDEASTYGVTVKDIEMALAIGYSGGRVTTYYTPINTYNVIVQMEDNYRLNPEALEKIWLRSTTSKDLVPLKNVASWKRSTGPLQVNHHNQFTSASIYFNLSPGYALSSAISKIDQLTNETVPSTLLRQFQGTASLFQGSTQTMTLLLILGIIAIYILLGSLYESFIHPFTILSTLPGALFGGLLMLFLFREALSIYSYVGLIVLIGIVMKNGIMLVEFANEQVSQGKTAYDAIVEAARERFRPILMTTVAASMGAVPIALGMGADAASRRPLGLVILGGLFFAQLITYFFTPVVYLTLEKFQERFKKS